MQPALIEAMEPPDFEAIFESASGAYLVVALDTTIVAANSAYLNATLKKRTDIIGRKLFDVFPNHPYATTTDTTRDMAESFARVLRYRRPDTMAVIKYDIPLREQAGGGFDERYWLATNTPVFEKSGDIRWILHRADDVTKAVVHDRATAESERLLLEQARVIAELQQRNSELHESQELLRASEARFRAAAEGVSDILWTTGADGFMHTDQPAWRAFTGQTREECYGHGAANACHPDDIERTIKAWESAVEKRERFLIEHRVRRYDGAWRLFKVTAQPVFGADGALREWVGVHADITEASSAEESRKLLLDELNHRVKNSLATVQSIAMQTLWSAPSHADFNREFNERLLALSLAHNLLTRSDWLGASLLEVVQQETAPYQDKQEFRVKIRGKDVYLAPKETLALSMAIHELATNAAKYGALSADAGLVEIEWSSSCDWPPRLRLTWTETGGPLVQAPSRRGFGSRLIERGITHELGGVASLNFQPSGVACVIEFPLRERC